jgi:MFS family permease
MDISTTTAQPATPTFFRASALGLTQILLWGGSYFFMAVIADPIVESTNWPRTWVVGALSIAILISGLPSPFVGRLIRTNGGKPVLVIGSTILALGLLVVAASPSLPFFLLGWGIMGFGMAGCLFDPLFSAVGQAYGTAARGTLTQITLISGFAITLCWPASSYLVQTVGWRLTCVAYATVAIVVVIPLFAWAIPRHGNAVDVVASVARPQIKPSMPAGLLRLGASFTVASMIMTAVSVELLMLLEMLGLSIDHAVALSALIGPAQVLVRGVEIVVGRHVHPYWGLLASALAALLGLSVLTFAPSLAWLAILLYGAGNGMRTVVRGTLPLALYGREEYATVMGQLARAPLIGQAATPLAAGLLVQYLGGSALLPGLLTIAGLNSLLALMVYPLMRKGGKRHDRI